MNTSYEIKHLSREQIDEKKWAACLEQCQNGLVYGCHHYLDAMCSHWDALVLNDYEALMPLPWRKKWGFRYIYQPAFIQQTGIFSIHQLSPEIVDVFLQKARKYYSFGELNLDVAPAKLSSQNRNNFILPLDQPYPIISSGYRDDLKKNLKEANKNRLLFTEKVSHADILSLYKNLYQSIMGIKEADYEHMEILIRFLETKGRVVVRGVFHEQEMVSGAVCLKDARRLYLLVSATNERGRKLSANHFLIDSLVKEFSETKLVLDFEGSDQPGIAHFYKNFGAENHPYYFILWNNLPWPVKYLKPLKAGD